MGTSAFPLPKPKPGHEEEFKKILYKQNPDLKEGQDLGDAILYLLAAPFLVIIFIYAILWDLWDKFFSKNPGVMSKREEEKYRKWSERLKEIAIDPIETSKSLRVGENKTANDYFMEVCYFYAQLRIKHIKEQLPKEYLERFSGPVESVLPMYAGRSIYDLQETEVNEDLLLTPLEWDPASESWKLGWPKTFEDDAAKNEEIRYGDIDADRALKDARRIMCLLFVRARKQIPGYAELSDSEIEREFRTYAFLEQIASDICYGVKCNPNLDYDEVLDEMLSENQKALSGLVANYCFLRWFIFWAELGHGHRLG